VTAKRLSKPFQLSQVIPVDLGKGAFSPEGKTYILAGGQKAFTKGVKMGEVIVINQENFSKEVEQSDLPVLVDFWAPWCGPCQMLSPVIEKIAEKYKGICKVGKVNVDENAEIAVRFGIRSIPTLLLFKNGQIVDRIVGFVPFEIIENLIKKAL